MSNGQSSRTELTTISVYALDGKGQVLYDPEHLEVLGRNMCFFSMVGQRGTLGSVLYLKTILPGARKEV